MLAQLERPTSDFLKLARYLVEGRQQPPDPSRVAWVMTRNLPTDDPERVAALMAGTAVLSKRCRHPCYHAIIAWALDEQPTPEIMQEIARRTLEMAGLGEHQALIMGHGDKPHAHMHMMINRVHPTTGRAWSTSHDFRRFDRIMKELADEYGFHHVPSHAFEPEMTDDLPKMPNSAATWAGRHGASTRRPQWPRSQARAYGATLSRHLDRGSTWDDVEHMLAEDGLLLEPKGRGLVVGDGTSYAKLSALELASSPLGLQKRHGRSARSAFPLSRPKAPSQRRLTSPAAGSSPPSGRPIWTVDAVDIARVIGDAKDVRAAIQTAVGQRKARIAKRSLIEQLMEELKETMKASTMLSPVRRRVRMRPAPIKKERNAARSGR